MANPKKNNWRYYTNYSPNKPRGLEKNSGEIVTVQGDALTILEIMQKHAQGIAPPRSREAIWENPQDFGDSPTEHLRRPDVDLVDKEHAQKFIKTVQQKQADAAKFQEGKTREAKAIAASAAQQGSPASTSTQKETSVSAETVKTNKKLPDKQSELETK